MVAKHFKLQELVDRITYETEGEAAWSKLSPLLISALDGLWEFVQEKTSKTPVIIVNNWSFGGDSQWRGLRTENCTVGTNKSQHWKGCAADCHVKGYDAEYIRGLILSDQNNPLIKDIMRMEAGVSWIHLDVKPVPNRIHLFNP